MRVRDLNRLERKVQKLFQEILQENNKKDGLTNNSVCSLYIVEHEYHDPKFKGFIGLEIGDSNTFTFIDSSVINKMVKAVGGSSATVGASDNNEKKYSLHMTINGVDVAALRQKMVNQ